MDSPKKSVSPTSTVVVVVGDSICLPRYLDGVEFYQTYPFLLLNWLRLRGYSAEVWNIAQAGVPINHLANRYRDYRSYVGSAKGNIGILHLGVVDCSPRPIPWFARNQIGKLPSFVRNRIIGFLHRYRVLMLRYFFSFVFTQPERFEQYYRELLVEMSNDFEVLFAVNIAPPGVSFYQRSPGIDANIECYNQIISKAIQDFDKVVLVDVWGKFNEHAATEKYMLPKDGHHLSVEGHGTIYKMITESMYSRGMYCAGHRYPGKLLERTHQ